ncbi:DUF1405 domain-containing protein [Salarchaeum japonicum]|uniref:DUF1405 domain-containing protein n=1 Tax=Salarchaeum japonicum TaxID=555573 RepID=UPI003C73AC6C
MTIPARNDLPWYVAPLPDALEDLAFRLLPVIVLVNLVGTAFGFWYYRFQLETTPLLAWVVVPDSPVATLFIGLSLAAYRLDWDAEWLHALAFFGCIKLGLWTPFVQLVVNGQGELWWAMYWFLVLSHAAMAVEAFAIHRYASFSVPAVAVAAGWYWFNDVVDYVAPLVGDFHHTTLRAEYVAGAIDHSVRAHDLAAVAAVTLTLLATFLALATRAEKLKRRN